MQSQQSGLQPGESQPLEPQSLESQSFEPQALEPQALNAAGRAYVLAAAVTTLLCLSILTLLIGGLWRPPLLAWPTVLVAYLRIKLPEIPAMAYGRLARAALSQIPPLPLAPPAAPTD